MTHNLLIYTNLAKDYTKILLSSNIPIHFGIFLLQSLPKEITLLLSISGTAVGGVHDCGAPRCITMQQFPFNSNIATTCHKLQGKTLKRLIINSFDYSKKNWVYVVLSRITSLQGLVLLEKLDDTRDFSCNSQLLHWEKKLRTQLKEKHLNKEDYYKSI